ncbi:MAG: TetR/AcrR family transcriptional regulator [Spirochaetota bacterium]
MPGRRKRGAGYREKIIQGASKLMIERGIANTSLADIADEVGISKGTLYYYYPSKGELIFDISERHIKHITSKIFSWIEESGKGLQPEEVLRLVFRTIVTSQTRGHIHVYLIQEALTDSPFLKHRFIQEYQNWATLIEDGLKKILAAGQDYKLLAGVILAALDGLLLQHLLGVRHVPLDDISRYLLNAQTVQEKTT